MLPSSLCVYVYVCASSVRGHDRGRIPTHSHTLNPQRTPKQQACKHAPEALDKALGPLDLLPRLLKLLKLPSRNEEGNRGPTENAVSALLSICQGRCGFVVGR